MAASTVFESEYESALASGEPSLLRYFALLVPVFAPASAWNQTAVLHLSDDEISVLIGQLPGTPLPSGMTKWEIVLETLGNDLEHIPFAISPGDGEPDPSQQ